MWNDYAWNKNASVIYMESPASVGFSTTADPEEKYTDDSTAQYNLNAMIEFFKKFPEFKNNDFYVSGESYGGVYVPYLSYYID